ncbi:MAG: response regulator transcription factor, partial [Bacteroidota bacterium]
MTAKRINIMLVDDHQLIIDGIRARLADQPHIKIISQADNGKEAIEKLSRSIGIDVLLMDVEMPVMNGFEATEKIRA